MTRRRVAFSDLKGLTLWGIQKVPGIESSPGEIQEIFWTTDSGRTFKMYHQQDCCESVFLEDICGDLRDLLGTPILEAREETNLSSEENLPQELVQETEQSYTWTFYIIRTIKGTVTLRWFGSSNGYYSESVDFFEIV